MTDTAKPTRAIFDAERLDEIERIARAATQGTWIPGHHTNPDHSCECKSILSEWYMGAICTIHESADRSIENGDNPPPEEAKANSLHIASMDPSTTLELTSALRAAQDEVERLRNTVNWQPIDTAPKDGKPLRVLYEDGCEEDGVYWSPERYCMLGAPQGSCGPGWVSEEAGNLPVDGITHWMPSHD